MKKNMRERQNIGNNLGFLPKGAQSSKILHSVKFCLDIHESCQTCVIGKIYTLEKWFIKAYQYTYAVRGKRWEINRIISHSWKTLLLPQSVFFYTGRSRRNSISLSSSSQKQVIASAEGGEKRKLFHTTLLRSLFSLERQGNGDAMLIYWQWVKKPIVFFTLKSFRKL